jgi:hemerythrin-like domain-containing protein
MATFPSSGPIRPGAGFDSPLEMLGACHERMQRQFGTLRRLVPHVAAHGADARAREAAAAVMRYFDHAAADHHADEEQDLFPALLEAMAGSDAVCLRDLVRALTLQHQELHRHWLALRPLLADIAAGQAAALDAALVERLVSAYTEHLQREDAELLPLAARLIDDAQWQRIGRAMRLRRGITGAD